MDNIPYAHPAWIEIDTTQLRLNIQAIRKHIGEHPKILFPVKANAYGHGLIDTAKAAKDLVDYFGVSCLQEGMQLRQSGISTPILVMGAIHAEQIPELIRHDLEVTVSSLYKAKLLADACDCSGMDKTLRLHVEVDTGMNRTGVRVATAPGLVEFIRKHTCFKLSGVYSHLATADEINHPFFSEEVERFLQFLQQHHLLIDEDILCHFANSAAVACHPQTHLDMVRPGLLAYGYYPRSDLPENLKSIQPCLSVKARVAYFKTIMVGQGVSYNHSYKAKKQSRIITVPLGYGDGYRRCLSNNAHVLLHGKRYPVVGNVCMDQFMVDIGEDSGYVGDVVTIVGKDKDSEVSVQEISSQCGTIPYEILCGFNGRLPRVYI